MRKIFEIVRTFDLEPFQAGDGDTFRFRLEVARIIGEEAFVSRIYRLETYRIQPTFPQIEGELPDWKNDALIFVADEMFDSASLKGNSVEDVLTKFQAALKKVFG